MISEALLYIIEKSERKRVRRCSMARDDFACSIAEWKERYPDLKLDERRLWQDYSDGEMITDLSHYVET